MPDDTTGTVDPDTEVQEAVWQGNAHVNPRRHSLPKNAPCELELYMDAVGGEMSTIEGAIIASKVPRPNVK